MLNEWVDIQEIYVACPGELATGGTELLHQLVHCLRSQGRDAYIFYYEKPEIGRPAVFDCYTAPVKQPSNNPRHLIVVPETGMHVLKTLPLASKCIWWLSIDNYFAYYGIERHPGVWRQIKDLFKTPKSYKWKRDKKVVHLVQSQYANNFLKKLQIPAHFLGDYLRENFLGIDTAGLPEKERWVCFNPKKGISFTRQLMASPVSWKWVELANLTPGEMRNLLLASKVYIDFGHHPGKDRIPREAAMAGCVVITGVDGSAGNSVDVPVPSAFKIDQHQAVGAQRALAIIEQALNDYDHAVCQQDGYRERIRGEKVEFEAAVGQLFGEIRQTILQPDAPAGSV